MVKKNEALTLEEKLEKALVPDWEQSYKVPENWCWTRLGVVFQWGSGGTPSRKKTEYYQGDILWIKTGELCNDYIYTTGEKITEKAIEESSAKIFPVDTVVIAMYGATIGKAAILGVEASTNQACACALPTEQVEVKFLFYYVMSQKDAFIKKGKGGAQPNISQEIIKNHDFPFPPLSEQKRIVERVESLFLKLDEAKGLALSALDGYENRRAAILHKAFIGKLTKKWRDENGVTLSSWKRSTLQDVCSIKITDGTHQTPQYSDQEKGVPFVSSKDVTSGVIDWSKIKYITKELHEILYKRVAPQMNDILLAKNGTTGVAAIVREEKEFDIYVTLALLRPDKQRVWPDYLYRVVNSPICKEQFNTHLTGIGVPNLHLRDIRTVTIPLPEVSEQKEIIRIIDSIFEKETAAKELTNVIEQIDLMKKVILARAFRGELGTNDPEDENAIELLKEIILCREDEPVKSRKQKTKTLVIAKEIQTQFATGFEEKIYKYVAANQPVTMNAILDSVSKAKRLEALSTVSLLCDKGLLNGEEEVYTVK